MSVSLLTKITYLPFQVFIKLRRSLVALRVRNLGSDVGSGVFVGKLVGVGSGVLVGKLVDVGSGVLVGKLVGVGTVVIVGSSNLPAPQVNVNKLMTKTRTTVICRFAFISFSCCYDGAPDDD